MDNLTLLAGIGLLAAFAQWAAWRARLPAILFLLLSGMLVGPVAGILDPDALFGELLFPLISLAVAAILFEGSLTLKFSELHDIGSTVLKLVSIGVVISWVIVSLIVHWLVGFDYALAALFGAVVVVTGPTVVMPMLRVVRPVKKVADILRWEGIVIDPIGALLAVLAFNFYVTVRTVEAFGPIATLFISMLAIGVGAGLLAGYGLGFILRRHWLPQYLRSPFTLLLVFAVFALADAVLPESGLLAVTVFGVVLANQRDIDVLDILDFKERLSVLLIGGLFILLAARIELAGLVAMGWPALLVVIGIIFVARPISVFVSAIGSDLSFREKLIIAWIGPRGIVCAAIAAVFALHLEDLGATNAELLVPLAFLVIIGTVVLQSLTAKPLAAALGVRDPAPAGYLIVGGSGVARMIAGILQSNDLRVVIADSDWLNIKRARMAGIETFFGNPVSEHADRYLDLSGIGNLLSLSGRTNLDAVTALNFRQTFGPQHIYELPYFEEKGPPDKHRIAERLRARRLFGDTVTYSQVQALLARGWAPKTTRLTEEFSFADYLNADRNAAPLPLFAIDPANRLHPVTDREDWKPASGWKVISLVEVKSDI